MYTVHLIINVFTLVPEITLYFLILTLKPQSLIQIYKWLEYIFYLINCLILFL